MKKLNSFVVGLALLAFGSSAGANQAPTCSEELGIDVHGHHVVGDYVAGIGHDEMVWPPAGREIGEVLAGRGAALPGGPGPGFHFPNGVAPGASFCTDSNSPGVHF